MRNGVSRSPEGRYQKEDEKNSTSAPVPARKHILPYRGPFGYDPMTEKFWQFLIIMMMGGVCVHLQRVIYGWTMWNRCLDKNRERFTSFFYLCDQCFWNDDSGRDGVWRFLHFFGGVFWMLFGAFQILTWNSARYDPSMMKIHRRLGKLFVLNALVLVIGVGTAPSIRDWIVNPTPMCTAIGLLGGVPGSWFVMWTKEYLGCPTFMFFPHFLTWSCTGLCACTATLAFSGMDKKRRTEHQCWGLLFAGLGCFDSINYCLKHVIVAFGMHVDDVAIYLLWWTPIVFVGYLFHTTQLSKVYTWWGFWSYMLIGFHHVPLVAGWYRIPVRDDYEELIKNSEMNPDQWKDIKARYGDSLAWKENTPTPSASQVQQQKDHVRNLFIGYLIGVPLVFAIFFRYMSNLNVFVFLEDAHAQAVQQY